MCLSSTQLRLQLYQGETDRGLLIAFWARHSLSISFLSPPSYCLQWNPHLLHHKGHWGAQLSHRSPTTTGATVTSLFILSSRFFISIACSKILLSVILMLLFHSHAISLSFPVWIPSFPAPTLLLSNSLCPAKYVTFAWPCFCLGVSLCYLRVPCISVGVLSCMSLSCKDRCLWS